MLLHPQIRFDPTVVTKGDFVGHPFRGNQWSDNKVTDIVGPRTADEIVTRADLVKFAEMPPAFIGDKELFTHATMSNADIPAILREGIKSKYETVYSSRPPLVRELSGTYVIFKADKGVAVKGTDIVEIGLSYDEYTFTGTIPPSDIVKVVEIYVYNAGGQSVREDELAKFILENPNDPQINDLPEKYKRWATLASDVTKGDFMGHPFRGNQWSDASGASTGASSSSASNNVTAQIDSLLQTRSDLVDPVQADFHKDHYADMLQQVADLGYEFDKKHSRSYVMLDGVSTYLGDLALKQPDHPISKLYNEFYVANDLRRDKYFEVNLKHLYGAFDLTEGVSVHEAATRILNDKVKAGIQSRFNGTLLSEQIDHFVRSEADTKTQTRYVRDEGCTGPTGIGKGATGVNKALRAGRVTPFAKQIDASMLITNQPFAGYRGASLPQSVIDQMVVGSSYKEKGFMSVSPLRNTATFYANERHKDKLGGANAKIVIFRMLLPTGTRADPMNTDEIVVARKSTVRIAAVREVNDPELGAIVEVDAVVEQ